MQCHREKGLGTKYRDDWILVVIEREKVYEIKYCRTNL